MGLAVLFANSAFEHIAKNIIIDRIFMRIQYGYLKLMRLIC